MATSFRAVMAMVKEERDRQDLKWGSTKENPHSVSSWLDIMTRELGEAWEASNSELALSEILQVVAVGVACLEQHATYDEEQTGKERAARILALLGELVGLYNRPLAGPGSGEFGLTLATLVEVWEEEEL